MKTPLKKLWAAFICILCAAALTLPAWAAETADASDAQSPSDNDAWFYGYLLQRAGASDQASLMSDAGSKLNAKDKELYDRLKVWIAQIASGEKTETVYKIVYSDFQMTWTAAELGVSDCFSAAGEAALTAKVEERYDYDTNAVISALLADCPYELYWYDKSETGGAAFHSTVPGYEGNATKVTFNDAPTFTVTMRVEQGYGGGTTVNRALHAGIDNVVTKAQSIVNANAGKGDYAKMLAYATEICNLVEYDHAAASNASTPYGDPWQLISVFDGDAATNVVCEGYAKAFKYLCDLSAFSNPAIECRLATGTLGGGTGAGPHMWNIVTMENGKHYIVDVTNSDDEDEPDPSYMFLKGATPDNAAGTRYTFYTNLVFLYDDDTTTLWDSAALTLDTADYPAPAPTPPPTPAPVQIRGCSLSLVDDIALNFYLSFATYADGDMTHDASGLNWVYHCADSAPTLAQVRSALVNALNVSESHVSSSSLMTSVYMFAIDGVTYQVRLSADAGALALGSGAYVKLTGSEAADAQTILISSVTPATVDGVDGTVYIFTAHMPAKRMNDKITLACYNASDTAYAMKTPAGASVTEFSYCVQDYLNLASAKAELKNVAEAMSAYGYYAQMQFSYDAANAVAPSASYASKVAAVTAADLTAYASANDGTVSGVSAVGDNLTLEAAITQRVIFQLDGVLSDYAFQLDGADVTPTAYPADGADAYCVEVPGVVAKDMDKAHTLTIAKGTETLTHQCSALSYACKALSDDTQSASLQNLVKAMYLYHTEAKAYFSSH